MNGALLPKSVLVDSNSFIEPMDGKPWKTADEPEAAAGRPVSRSTFGNGFDASAGRAGEELPRPADLVFGIGHHLVQLRDPPDGPRERENRREKLHRNADRLLHDAGVEIDVRVQLALDEVVVLERDLLERHRQLEQRIVAESELAQHLVARLAHQLGARIVVLVDAMS